LSEDTLSRDEVLAGLKSSFWKEVVCLGAVGSTNDIALSLPPDEGLAYSGIVVVADSQEGGRGRLGRKWESPPGLNIYMSILMKPDLPAGEVPLLTMLAALASAVALNRETGLHVSIKWPNDLVVTGKKLGGILTEARTSHNIISRAVIGIGINLNSTEADFPPEISGNATSVRIEMGSVHSRNLIIAAVMNEFEAGYNRLRTWGGSLIVKEIKPLLSSIGKQVFLSNGVDRTSVFAEDLDDTGRLIIRLSSGERRVISSGEILER